MRKKIESLFVQLGLIVAVAGLLLGCNGGGSPTPDEDVAQEQEVQEEVDQQAEVDPEPEPEPEDVEPAVEEDPDLEPVVEEEEVVVDPDPEPEQPVEDEPLDEMEEPVEEDPAIEEEAPSDPEPEQEENPYAPHCEPCVGANECPDGYSCVRWSYGSFEDDYFFCIEDCGDDSVCDDASVDCLDTSGSGAGPFWCVPNTESFCEGDDGLHFRAVDSCGYVIEFDCETQCDPDEACLD